MSAGKLAVPMPATPGPSQRRRGVVVRSLIEECRYVGGRTLPEPVLALGRAVVATVEDLVDQAAHDELVGPGHRAPSWSAWWSSWLGRT
jgi:hypothetical protein